MVGNQALVHTADLTLGMYEPWQKLGENIGFGRNNETLWNAFAASPPLYHNVIDPSYDRVGVASEIDGNGIEWTTHRFMHAGAPVAPPVPTVPVTSPPPTRAPTTRAPLTSPPTHVPPTVPSTSPLPLSAAGPEPTSTTSTSTSTSSTSSSTTTSMPAAAEPASSTPPSVDPATSSATAAAPATTMEPGGPEDDSASAPTGLAKAGVLLALVGVLCVAELIFRFAIRPA